MEYLCSSANFLTHTVHATTMAVKHAADISNCTAVEKTASCLREFFDTATLMILGISGEQIPAPKTNTVCVGLLTCKNRLSYNLYCVGGNVKHCTIQSCVHRPNS